MARRMLMPIGYIIAAVAVLESHIESPAVMAVTATRILVAEDPTHRLERMP